MINMYKIMVIMFPPKTSQVIENNEKTRQVCYDNDTVCDTGFL